MPSVPRIEPTTVAAELQRVRSALQTMERAYLEAAAACLEMSTVIERIAMSGVEEDPLFCCPKCPAVFATEDDLDAHILDTP